MEKVIIVGHGSSGKNFLAEKLQNSGNFSLAPSYTTRPKRKGEIDGKDYKFINVDYFEKMIKEGLLYEYNEFKNKWYYGISKEDWEKYNLFITNPKGVENIRSCDRKKCFIIFIDIDEKIRKERLSKRNDNNDSVERRLERDKVDFENFTNYDMKITDPHFNPYQIYSFFDN